MQGEAGRSGQPRGPDRGDGPQAEFIRRYMAAQPALRAYVLSVVRDFHIAEDALQEIAVAAWKGREQYDDSRPFVAWAMGIARNKALDALRAKGQRPALPDEVILRLEIDATAVVAEAEERRKALAGCLEKLGRVARSIFRLRFEEELSPREIAERQNRSLFAVKKALSRARAFLMRCTQQALSGGVGVG